MSIETIRTQLPYHYLDGFRFQKPLKRLVENETELISLLQATPELIKTRRLFKMFSALPEPAIDNVLLNTQIAEQFTTKEWYDFLLNNADVLFWKVLAQQIGKSPVNVRDMDGVLSFNPDAWNTITANSALFDVFLNFPNGLLKLMLSTGNLDTSTATIDDLPPLLPNIPQLADVLYSVATKALIDPLADIANTSPTSTVLGTTFNRFMVSTKDVTVNADGVSATPISSYTHFGYIWQLSAPTKYFIMILDYEFPTAASACAGYCNLTAFAFYTEDPTTIPRDGNYGIPQPSNSPWANGSRVFISPVAKANRTLYYNSTPARYIGIADLTTGTTQEAVINLATGSVATASSTIASDIAAFWSNNSSFYFEYVFYAYRVSYYRMPLALVISI